MSQRYKKTDHCAHAQAAEDATPHSPSESRGPVVFYFHLLWASDDMFASRQRRAKLIQFCVYVHTLRPIPRHNDVSPPRNARLIRHRLGRASLSSSETTGASAPMRSTPLIEAS